METFLFDFRVQRRSVITDTMSRIGFTAAATLIFFLSLSVDAQEVDSRAKPVVVQPGAPGQPTRTLPASTKGMLPPRSPKEVEFMQGMIMHHAQAVEMTDLIESRTQNRDIRLIGTRISKSQLDEIEFMNRWLDIRGERPSATKSGGHDHGSGNHKLMPGMLSPQQMDALKKVEGAEFDHLFLTGMIQHHEGALVMVKDLFDTAGAGQDAELFNFASDVDSGQRAEIRSMQTLLGKKP